MDRRGNHIACKVAELWRFHREQTVIFKRTMTEEVSGELRDICGKGYLISTLCMNEIQVIYNDLKSPLAEISSDSDSQMSGECMGPGEEHALVRNPDYLRRRQKMLIDKYHGVVQYFENVGVSPRVLTDHVSMAKKMVERLESVSRSFEDMPLLASSPARERR